MTTDVPSAQRPEQGFSLEDIERPWNWLVDRLDRFQRRHRPLALVWGIWRRYSEDSGNHFAALVSFYAFFSIFPLLLVLVTTLGIVLAGEPGLRDDIVNSAVAQFPVIGEQITENAIDGHGVVLVLGLLTALYAGLRAVDALQHAMNTMWNVPQYRRPNILKRKLRDVAVVGVLGGGVLGATVSSGLGAFVPMPVVGRIFSLLGTAVVNVGVLLLVFRLLTNCPLELRRILTGAAIGGLALMGLQVLGGVYVRDVVKDASDTYGVFAAVLGLLTWVALQARIVLFASETNVVVSDHLWPRGMSGRMPTEADLRAFRLSTEREARRAEHTDPMGMPARPLDTA
jgi:inner membrane protein YhjD